MTCQKKTRKTYTVEFKEEVLKLAAKVGLAQAARELSIFESQLYEVQHKRKRPRLNERARLSQNMQS